MRNPKIQDSNATNAFFSENNACKNTVWMHLQADSCQGKMFSHMPLKKEGRLGWN